MRTLLLLALLFGAVAGQGNAQVLATVGPAKAPVGCPIRISISNDSPKVFGTGVCPYRIVDSSGRSIPLPPCPAILQLLRPGETFTTAWDQRDAAGVRVPPGNYTIEVFVGPRRQAFAVSITTNETAGVAPIGVSRVGTARNLALCSVDPRDGGRPYVAMAALSAQGTVMTCAGPFPLDPDPLLQFSLVAAVSGGPVFLNFVGNLDANGRSTAPAFDVPDIPALNGLEVYFAFFVPRNGACPIGTMSAAEKVTIRG